MLQEDFSVSIILPVYNAAPFIAKAVASALMQPEVAEVLLIEDGSEDDSMEVCKELVRDNKKVKLYTHTNNLNKGAGASRNVGIKHATSMFIAFLDADDFYLPNRFLKDKEIFVKYPDADGCYNALGTYFYSESAKPLFMERFRSEVTTVAEDCNPTPKNLFYGLMGFIKGYGYFHLDTLTLRRDALIKTYLLFNEELRLHQDTDFTFKLSYYCRLYPSSINEPVALRGVHDNNRITANFRKEVKEQNFKQFLLWKSLLKWSKEENLKNNYPKVFHHFKDNYDYNRLILKERPNSLTLFKEILTNFDILKNKHYRKIHRLFTCSLGDRVSFGLLRVKNIFYSSRT